MSGLQLFLMTLAMCAGSVVQGSIGYGISLVANPILVWIDPAFIPGPILLTTLPLSLLMALRERQSLNLSELRWAVVGRVLGAVIAAGILAVISQDTLVTLLGIMLLAAVIITAGGLRIPLTQTNLLFAGTLAGIMGTIAAIGGPPMALVYQRESGARIRSSLAGFFLFGTSISIFTLWLVGRFGWREVQLGVMMMPGALLGYLISSQALRWLPQRWIRTAVLILSAASAVLVLAQQWL